MLLSQFTEIMIHRLINTKNNMIFMSKKVFKID